MFPVASHMHAPPPEGSGVSVVSRRPSRVPLPSGRAGGLSKVRPTLSESPRVWLCTARAAHHASEGGGGVQQCSVEWSAVWSAAMQCGVGCGVQQCSVEWGVECSNAVWSGVWSAAMQCLVECSAPVRCSSAIALWGGVERVGVQWCAVAAVEQSGVQ